jgi:DNA-binding NtrC family response regulator
VDTILVVSSDASDPALIEAAVPGIRLTYARNCKEAISMVRSGLCCAVLCDRTLSDGYWNDLLFHIRVLPHAPPVVVMSQSADESMWAEVLSQGAFDLLSKPLDGKEVRRALSIAREIHTRVQLTTA